MMLTSGLEIVAIVTNFSPARLHSENVEICHRSESGKAPRL